MEAVRAGAQGSPDTEETELYKVKRKWITKVKIGSRGKKRRRRRSSHPVVENEMGISTKTQNNIDTKHFNTQDIKDIITNTLSLWSIRVITSANWASRMTSGESNQLLSSFRFTYSFLLLWVLQIECFWHWVPMGRWLYHLNNVTVQTSTFHAFRQTPSWQFWGLWQNEVFLFFKSTTRKCSRDREREY